MILFCQGRRTGLRLKVRVEKLKLVSGIEVNMRQSEDRVGSQGENLSFSPLGGGGKSGLRPAGFRKREEK